MSNVERAHDKRLKAIQDPRWEDAMVVQILSNAEAHFRWFDSGDVQSVSHALQICNIAKRTPTIQHWCPSQENKIWNGIRDQIPKNLTVRMSGIKIGKRRASRYFPTSMTMHSNIADWKTLVSTNTTDMQRKYYCPAPVQGNKCLTCRACWNKSIKTVVYKQH